MVVFFFHRSSQGAEGHFQGLYLSKAFEGQAQVVCGTASYSEIKFFQNWYLLIMKQYAAYGDNRFLSEWPICLGFALGSKQGDLCSPGEWVLDTAFLPKKP